MRYKNGFMVFVFCFWAFWFLSWLLLSCFPFYSSILSLPNLPRISQYFSNPNQEYEFDFVAGWTVSCDDPADVAAEFSEASDSAAVEVDEGTTVNGTSSCWTTGSVSFGVISSRDWPKAFFLTWLRFQVGRISLVV